MLAVAFDLQAQNVFISPETGHLIAAVTYENETGFENGFSALWRHSQLGLNMAVSDDADLTKGGEIANPAGNLNTYNGKLTITGGTSKDCYIVVSLPKGYRFTGYSITLDNNINNHTFASDFTTRGVKKTFYETGSSFDNTNYKAKTDEMPESDDTKAYTMSRQAANKTDMGNRLYFRLCRSANVNDRYYGVSIRSFEVQFSADAAFDQPLNSLPFSTAKGVAASPFMVGKLELGAIKPNSKNGKTYISYDYRNVDDLEANNLLYQASAVKGGKAADGNAANKTITCTINKDGLAKSQAWFALAKSSSEDDNTYYVETPVTLTSISGKEFPIGYRITGAKLEFALGRSESSGYTIGINRHGEMSYLHGDGTIGGSDPETGWQINRNGNLTLNGTTMYVASGSGSYYLTTNSWMTAETTFGYTANGTLYADVVTRTGFFGRKEITRMYIHEGSTAGQRAVLNTEPKNAAQFIQYSAFTPSANGFTATVYDKTGKAVAETASISTANNNQVINIDGLNNDAVKFKISGLSDGSQALVRVTLTMEHLNPFIHSMDITGRDATDNMSLTHNFTADNFSVRGGRFVFSVPEGRTGHVWNFDFDNLTSNYTDETYKSDSYKGATDGNARVAFVESKYFKANEDLYAEGYDPDYTPASDKLKVVEVGTKPFRFNNADELANVGTSRAERQLEEYPFSVAKYLQDTGYKDNRGNAVKGEFKQVSLTAGQEYIAYIFISDETRYNIAPTSATQHRFYAHYAMDLELQEKEYQLTITPVKVYDKTFYTDKNNDEKESSMWGIKVSTTEADGYAHLSDVLAKISDLCDKNENGLSETGQILYVDMSSLQSIVLPENNRTEYLNQFRNMMAANCLVYLPNNTAYRLDNFAHKAQSEGQFSANSNIILSDKQPFFAPYAINVPATSYAKYTRNITHNTTGKSNITTLVLPFQFSVASDGLHTNDNEGDRAGDGKSFKVNKLSDNNAISTDKGEAFDDFDNRLVVSYKYFVHFDTYNPSTGKTEAYKPYLIYIKDADQLEGNENFTVLEYGANVVATPDAQSANPAATGMTKIADTGNKVTGSLDGESFTLTPTASMAGCKLAKNSEKCLYFSADRFRSSWTLTSQYDHVYMFPFRSWFAYEGNTSKAKEAAYGIAFGYSGETTGIEDITTEKDKGTYKFVRDGKMYIRTSEGVFTVDGIKVNE